MVFTAKDIKTLFSSPSQSSSSPSFVLTSTVAVIFTAGIAVGYLLFYVQFHSVYMTTLESTNTSHNATLTTLQQRLHDANTAKKQCQDSTDSQLLTKIYELRGRLESQSQLASSHRDLHSKYQRAVRQLDRLNLTHSEEMKTLRNELTQSTEHQLTQLQSTHNNEMISLKTQLEESTTTQVHTIESSYQITIDHLQTKLKQTQQQLELVQHVQRIQQDSNCYDQIVQTKHDTQRSYQNYIQSRERVMCRQWFDQHKGPYRVEFIVDVPSSSDDIGGDNSDANDSSTPSISFIIEIPSRSRKAMPHSVFTFLTLVESTTYDDHAVSFVGFSNDQKVLQIAHSSSIDSPNDGDGSVDPFIDYIQRLGYPYHKQVDDDDDDDEDGVLAFLEEPSFGRDKHFRCRANSIGFIQRGPRLKLFLEDDAEWGGDGSNSVCFGYVMDGQESALQSIRHHVIELRTQLYIRQITYLPPTST